MNLEEYLDSKPFVRVRRGLGNESDWFHFCDLDLPGGILHIFDPGMLPGAIKDCKVDLTAGCFEVSAKVITYWKDSRISRLRICLPQRSVKLGRRIGCVDTDLGLIGVADHQMYMAQWRRDPIVFQETVSDEIPESGPCSIARLGAPPSVVVPFVESGFGDGRYYVYVLDEANQQVGAEIVFIRKDSEYPFGG